MYGVAPAHCVLSTNSVVRRLLACHGATFEHAGDGEPVVVQGEAFVLFRNTGGTEPARLACAEPLRVGGSDLRIVPLRPSTALALVSHSGEVPSDLSVAEVCEAVADAEDISLVPHGSTFVAPDHHAAAVLCAPDWRLKLCAGHFVVGFSPAAWEIATDEASSEPPCQISLAVGGSFAEKEASVPNVVLASSTSASRAQRASSPQPPKTRISCSDAAAATPYAFSVSDTNAELAAKPRLPAATVQASQGGPADSLHRAECRVIITGVPPHAGLPLIFAVLAAFGPLKSLGLGRVRSDTGKCNAYALFESSSAATAVVQSLLPSGSGSYHAQFPPDSCRMWPPKSASPCTWGDIAKLRQPPRAAAVPPAATAASVEVKPLQKKTYCFVVNGLPTTASLASSLACFASVHPLLSIALGVGGATRSLYGTCASKLDQKVLEDTFRAEARTLCHAPGHSWNFRLYAASGVAIWPPAPTASIVYTFADPSRVSTPLEPANSDPVRIEARGLVSGTTEEEIRSVLSLAGGVVTVLFGPPSQSNKKVSAFVTFTSAANAEAALKLRHRFMLHGELLRLFRAAASRDPAPRSPPPSRAVIADNDMAESRKRKRTDAGPPEDGEIPKIAAAASAPAHAVDAEMMSATADLLQVQGAMHTTAACELAHIVEVVPAMATEIPQH